MSSRLASRARLFPYAVARRFTGGRLRPADPRSILIAHDLRLGDTLMLTPLLAKIRERYPAARLAMTVRPPAVPIYAPRPYGVEAIGFDPHVPETLSALLDGPGFDLAFVPGDNRFSWVAAAAGARWIVAHGGDRPAYKNWPVDELRPYPGVPAAWGDMAAELADGPPPRVYSPRDWPEPNCAPFARPAQKYAVLHVGASSPLKQWQAEKWRNVAATLASRNLIVVWSAGRGEEGAVAAIDPQGRYPSCAGQLDLAQLWHLVKGAHLLVCPDTSVAHLGRIVGTPTITLFGPGSAVLCGAGRFWRDAPYRAVTVEGWHCRDQRQLFKREIAWVRHCSRSPAECATPTCMHAIEVETVLRAVRELLGGGTQ